MDPLSLLMGALATGAASAAKDTASQAVKDAYATLKGLLKKRFVSKPHAELALNAYEQDPETWQKPLQKSLLEVQAEQDQDIVNAAQQLVKLAEQQQASPGTVSIYANKGYGIIGINHGTVTQHFSDEG